MKENSPLDDVRACYNVRHWSQGYYGINDGGDVYVAPVHDNKALSVNLSTIVEKIQDQVATIIEDGIDVGEISIEINAMQYAKRIDTMIVHPGHLGST
mgnify:CR=1 FL=1